MRDYAAETEAEARGRTETAPQDLAETPQGFVVDMILTTFRSSLVTRLAFATQIFITLATGIGLVAAVWALTTA
jgi:hypothetical protein